MVPISLLACMTETRMVRGVMAAAMRAGSTSPSGSMGTTVSRNPWLASCWQAVRTALCSIAVVMMWSPVSRSAAAIPVMARWSDSVAPEVKMIFCVAGRADQVAYLPPCGLDGGSGGVPVGVRAGRVAVAGGEVGHHRVQDARVDGRGGLVVEVNHLIGGAHAGLPGAYLWLPSTMSQNTLRWGASWLVFHVADMCVMSSSQRRRGLGWPLST
jgi:hypothetical protein